MSLRKLPDIRADIRLDHTHFDTRPDALEKWSPDVRAASAPDEASLSVLDVIGENWDGTGVTAKRIGAALRSIGTRDVVVNINSPGGDFFEGVAIYNLLRNHPARVTVRVLGLAASAASVIAMAGDDILMGEGAFLMIHNAWAVAMGNRHDLADAAQRLAPFDDAMAGVYAARVSMQKSAAAELMDAETWLSAGQAVEQGFADGLLDRADITETETQAGTHKAVLAQLEAALAKTGHTRSQRREAFAKLFADKPGAVGPAMPRAGDTDAAVALHTLLHTIRG